MARRYAAALAEVVTAQGEAREVQDELTSWDRMVQSSPELLEVFRNPTIPYDQKRSVLKALVARVRLRQTTANFLQVLLQNHRLPDLGEINKSFAKALDERAGVVSAHVTTAHPVPETVQESLRARLTSLTGQKVRLQFAVDEGLLGGIVTRIVTTLYDGSLLNLQQQNKQKNAVEH
ncbi:MAG: ATP synthase F1 subunit delta [Pyrinomonadaceae bacterium]